MTEGGSCLRGWLRGLELRRGGFQARGAGESAREAEPEHCLTDAATICTWIEAWARVRQAEARASKKASASAYDSL
jgi:hypothetical protein